MKTTIRDDKFYKFSFDDKEVEVVEVVMLDDMLQRLHDANNGLPLVLTQKQMNYISLALSKRWTEIGDKYK